MSSQQCYECGKVFSNTSSLRRHARNFHNDAADEIAPNCYKNVRNYNYNCQCGKNFSDERNFKAHQRSHEAINIAVNASTKKCPLCGISFNSKNEILKHFEDFHEIVILSSKIEFNTEEEFFLWKNKLEADTNTSFIKNNNKSSAKCKIYYFGCNRSGNYVSQLEEDKRKRHLKTQGTLKINAYCPASIKLVIDKLNNTCEAEYIETHVGHGTKPRCINLSKPNRNKIGQKISSRIPFDEILNEVCENVTESEVCSIHLKRKDLYNIEQSSNRSSSAVRHLNDGVCVEAWVKEMQEKKHPNFSKNFN